MRQAGILCPMFSLPGRYGIGDFGSCAYRFIDVLADAGFRIWQMLPLNPVGYGNSPYQPYSSFAGDTVYIDLEALYRDGLLSKLPEAFCETSAKVDYIGVRAYKEKYLKEAFSNFTPDADYEAFVSEDWVYDYAVFTALKEGNGGKLWNEWKKADREWIRTRSGSLKKYDERIRYEMFLQYLFRKQWLSLKTYAKQRKLKLMGDIPFYVGADSLDVWSAQDNFLLDPKGYPSSVAGVPPDYFSADGQRWGNPIYDWDFMTKDGFRFWIDRVKGNAVLFDYLRIDHFRAFDTYWKIPASCETAKIGEWIEAPGYAFFDKLLPEIRGTKIVAEDLGLMRPEVYTLRDHYRFPGMHVLQFTLLDKNAKLKKNMIAYTGTHDNDTTRGWYTALKAKEKKAVRAELLRRGYPERNVSDAFTRLLFECKADTAILMIQDTLNLPTDARINLPGTVSDKNWSFKLTPETMTKFAAKAKKLKKLIRESGR